ncbi:MAG: 1-deoxy-D-xylulose-5-phosphate reductoisomerase [Epsilonproteobacteria bacterium]|nr:1-deoxy-D-xylulose-5-phosphate reductoisomerase [Campylobacterota bacterium]
MNSLVLLGSTGSIGINTLDICRRFNIRVEALVARENSKLLQKQIDEFKPKYVAILNKDRAKDLSGAKIFTKEEGILRVIEESSSKLVVNALVGLSGLKPTLRALKLNKKIALANKESLVVGGAFLDTKDIVPIDSEHFALNYLLNDKKIKRLIITASGGALRDWSIDDLKRATFIDALKHPNWSMGEKITIDSATMVNKLFELLEAKWLFKNNNIDAYIEERSLIHALIEFLDGSISAHISRADMRLPIAYAILEDVSFNVIEPLDLKDFANISLKEIDSNRYLVWKIKDDLLKNPKRGAILNSINEAAILKFKRGDLNFYDFMKLILDSYIRFSNLTINSIEDIFEIDKKIKKEIK